MQTTFQSTMTAGIRPRLAPHETFWIPMLIRSTPKPAPVASPTSDATAQHFAPIVAYAAPCVVPTNDTEDRAVAEADEANDASEEARCARQAATELAAIHPSGSDEADLAKSPAAARHPPAPLEERGDGVTALLISLALSAVVVAILNMPGLAGGPVIARDRRPGLADRPVASASDPVPETPGAGGRPSVAPPAERIASSAAAPALVAHDRAPTESVVVPAACDEAVDAEIAPTHTPIASETPVWGEYGPRNMYEEIGSIVAVGGDVRPDGAAASDVTPALEAAPEVSPAVSTSAPRQRSRSPRERAQHQGKRAGVVATQVIPTSRALLDEPMDEPGDEPVSGP